MKWTAADDDRDGLFIFWLSGSSSYFSCSSGALRNKKI
jgi:hypothetical protein